MYFPSGEIAGEVELRAAPLSDICTGSPPAVDTLQSRGWPAVYDVYTTHRPSGEQRGLSSSTPRESCTALVPSAFIFQISWPPPRLEIKTKDWPLRQAETP